MASYREQQNFIESVVPRSLLEDAVDWIRNNMTPEDVFTKADLSDWAKDNGFVEDKE